MRQNVGFSAQILKIKVLMGTMELLPFLGFTHLWCFWEGEKWQRTQRMLYSEQTT